MISRINIKNFAIIEEADIEFRDGLCIITGETGSGKSIVANAISLVLGARADTTFIRAGSDKALVQMLANLDGEEYIITRELSSNGKNLCKINGEIVTLSQLRQLTARIADIHGQYDTQTLLDEKKHIDIVDIYNKEDIGRCKDRVARLFHEYKDILLKMRKHKEDLLEYSKKRTFMEEEIKLIQDADIKIDEDIELAKKLELAQNQERIHIAWEKIYDICNGEGDSILNSMTTVQKEISDISDISKEANEMDFEFADIYFKMEDITNKILSIKDRSSYSPQDIQLMSERLDMIEALKRRYATDIKGILDHLASLEKETENVIEIADKMEAMTTQKEALAENLKVATDKLTQLRKQTIVALEKKLQAQLDDLNFKDAKVKIKSEISNRYTAKGRDIIEFLISTNKGEPLKPLSKIASGGEMSRIMLAFKSIIADYDGIGSMIFDEIDNGISGIAASKVGKKLKDLAAKRQVIVITHLPQIAAMGDSNYSIYKIAQGDRTVTEIRKLSDQEKVEEIARLMSGDTISDSALKNAQNLIEASK